jgi:hypothetical protein
MKRTRWLLIRQFSCPLAVLALSLGISTAGTDSQSNKLTITVDDITFDSAYDNGSLAGISRRSLHEYDATLFTDSGEKGPQKYWLDSP